jgi:RNA polymerase sigma-70 factor (ECF subfamily)
MSAADTSPQQSIHTLYSDHHGWLYDWLRRRLGNAFDAADLAHDAFLRIMARPPVFDGFDGARAYLGSIARNLVIDLWRRREIERAWLETLAVQPEAVAPSPEQRAIVLETLFEIDAMLRSLPERAARAFVLAQLHGLTYREIAARIGVSERMVKKYMAQAMLHCIALEAGMQPALVE